MPLAPLAGMSDAVLLIVRVVLGTVMMYQLWGAIALVTELGGGLAVVVGLFTWLAAALVLIAFGPGPISIDAAIFGI